MKQTSCYTIVDQYILGNSSSAVALYLSIVSGYLVVAYIVGNKLTHAQVLIISGLFVFATSYCTANLTTWYQRALEFANEAKAINPKRIVSNNEYVVTYTGILFSLGIVASLYFMWDVRLSKTK